MLKNYKQVLKYFSDLQFSFEREDDALFLDEDGLKVRYGGLERVKKTLSFLGNPEESFKIIHVVGTAGKTSTSTIIFSLLQREGEKVGLFTSPYLSSVTEMIRVNDLFISESELILELNCLLPDIKKLKKHQGIFALSFFELMFVLALIYFQKKGVTYAVLEAGLGGKYDATNAIRKSEISVLTSIGEDHTEILGNVDNIIKDKASISEKSKKLITAVTDLNLLNQIQIVCNKTGSELLTLNDNLAKQCGKLKPNAMPLSYFNNFILALQAVHMLGFKTVLNRDDMDFKIPCRMEWIDKDRKILLDGSHNPDKINILSQYIDSFREKKIILLFSIFEDKDYESVLSILLPKVEKVIFTSLKTGTRISPHLNIFEKVGLRYLDKEQITMEENNLRAYKIAKTLLDDKKILVITGSFTLAARIRELYWSLDKIHELRKLI